MQRVLSAVQTDTVEKNQVTSAQMWVLLLGQLVFLVWLLVLNKVQVSHVTLCNNSTDNPSKAHCMPAAIQPWVSRRVYHLVWMRSADSAVCKHACMSHGVIAQHQHGSIQMPICNAFLQHGRWLRCSCV